MCLFCNPNNFVYRSIRQIVSNSQFICNFDRSWFVCYLSIEFKYIYCWQPWIGVFSYNKSQCNSIVKQTSKCKKIPKANLQAEITTTTTKTFFQSTCIYVWFFHFMLEANNQNNNYAALTMVCGFVCFIGSWKKFLPSEKKYEIRDVYRDEKWSKCERMVKKPKYTFLYYEIIILLYSWGMPEPVCLLILYSLYIQITETLTAPNSLCIVELQSFAASLI